MTEKDQNQEQSKSTGGPESPMEMGMGMAKKMMAQMGQGGNPMEMMHKMMSQMGTSEGKPPMEMMMGMCSGMLNAIRETNALAVHGTPELRAAFTEWLGTVEEKALAALKEGEKDAAALGAAVGISEESARAMC